MNNLKELSFAALERREFALINQLAYANTTKEKQMLKVRLVEVRQEIRRRSLLTRPRPETVTIKVKHATLTGDTNPSKK